MNLKTLAELLPDLVEPCKHCSKLRIMLEDWKLAAVKAVGDSSAGRAIVGPLRCKCHMCDDTSFVLTEKGKAMLAFLERYAHVGYPRAEEVEEEEELQP